MRWASSLAVASDLLSEYTRMIGSVLEVRRCTHSLSNSIFSPSSVLIGWAAYFVFILLKMCCTFVSSCSSILFLDIK